MSLDRVPDGTIATIVTSLQMLEKPKPQPLRASQLRLVRWKEPGAESYRTLFRRVGEPWLWFSRLQMPEAELLAIIRNPAVEVYAVLDPRGVEVGLLELDFREAGTCELAYFGLVPELNGRGDGRWLMGQALALAWRAGIARFWVHTCTLDSPRALGFYRAQGFVPYGRAVETFPDPRLHGLLPREAAPQIPLIG